MFHQVNIQDADYSPDEYNQNIYAEDGVTIIDTRDQRAIAAISQLIVDTPLTIQQVNAMRNFSIAWVKDHTTYDITM